MVKKFTAKMSFKLKKEDSKLYHKYGVPAIELANDGEYLAAIKLLDKVLKENLNSEFALLLKANYLFNYFNENQDFEAATPTNLVKIKKQALELKIKLEECINLIDKVLKLNPKNKEAKEFRTFVSGEPLKSINSLLKKVNETEDSISKFHRIEGTDAKLICPYCKFVNLMVKVKKTEDEYNCSKCNKTFLAIIGEVRAARGLGGYVAHTVTIRLKNIEGGESVVNYYSTYQGNEFRSGDIIGVVYKKGWLSNSYGSKPTYIMNWNTGLYSANL